MGTKTMSLQLQEPIFVELETLVEQLNKNRNAYINEAVAYYNKIQRRKLLAEQLEKECLAVRAADYEVFKEMEDPVD